MAKGKKTGGRDFKPGIAQNPNGRPKDPPELKAIKSLNKAEYQILLNKILYAKPDELPQFKENIMQLWLSSVASSAIKSGDYTRLDQIISRLIGKVPDKIEVSELEQLSDEEILKLGLEAVENLKKKINKED